MKIILFDLCSIPIYLLIFWTCLAKKMTKGHANRLFISVNVISLICVIADICMEYVVNPLPLTQAAVVLGTAISFTYKLLRNACTVVYLVYLFAVTKTEYKIQNVKNRLILWLPNIILVVALVQNFFTHNVFVVTAENGYSRGPLLFLLYAIAFLYGAVGTGYCLSCRRYFPFGKWIALLSIYILTYISVIIQMIKPNLMVEMFFTSIGMMMILLMVMRPEESMDANVGTLSWKAYQADLKNILLSGQRVQIVVLNQSNAGEMRSYLGEDDFYALVTAVKDEVNRFFQDYRNAVDVYFESPGNIYLILYDAKLDMARLMPEFLKSVKDCTKAYSDRGMRVSPKVCIIKVPTDVADYQEIINLGHRFPQLGAHDQDVFIASDIVKSPNYTITNHIEEILNRAINAHSIVMYYQPIYSVREGKFCSAEALARLIDREYGIISPAVFITAAEKTGLMLPIGEIVLESVFRFISEHDLDRLGLSYIEINLSVAQCLQADLPQTVRRLQDKYGIDPHRVNFEITETMFDNLNGVMDRNLRELTEMGYSFALDDYGVGYSNIQRLRTLPLKIIKIDKSMVDDMHTEDGAVIIESTVHMMQGIQKQLVVEGVETKKAMDALSELSCDFIQGFYYSKPLPAKEFVRFLEEHNRVA